MRRALPVPAGPFVCPNMPLRLSAAADYCNNAVAWAVSSKLTSGTSMTTFSPRMECPAARRWFSCTVAFQNKQADTNAAPRPKWPGRC